MSNFRTSTIPEWSASEGNGYFRSRKSADNNPSPLAPPAPVKRPVICLPKNVDSAASQMKHTRITRLFKEIFLMQMAMFAVLFMVFPLDFKDEKSGEKTSYFKRVMITVISAVFSLQGITCAFVLYFALHMFAVVLTKPTLYGTCIQEQINQFASLRFIFKGFIIFGFITWYFWYYLALFDPDHLNIFGYKDKEYIFFENILMIRIAVSVAVLHFFIESYKNGDLWLRFPSVSVVRHTGSLFELQELTKFAHISFLICITVGLGCLLIGSMSVYPLIQLLTGARIRENMFWERIMMLLDVTFMIRLFICTYVARRIPLILLKMVNGSLVENVNFHVESEANHDKCLLLSDAMNGQNIYMKYLAFYEFCFKTDSGNQDVAIFYKITHPGNHPQNWRNVFNPCINTVKLMNEKIVRFLKTSKMPENFFQAGLGPYILNQLRENEAINEQNAAISTPVGAPRGAHMRDLTSPNRPEFPDGAPNIADILYDYLMQRLNEFKSMLSAFFSTQTINSLIFGGRLEIKLPEYTIANILSDHLLTYWAITGTQNLIYRATDLDVRGVVHQDIKPFLIRVLEAYDSLIALEIYITRSLDDQPGVDRNIAEKNKEIIMKLSNACVFTLAKLHFKFSNCYSILDIDEDIQQRILEVIGDRSY